MGKGHTWDYHHAINCRLVKHQNSPLILSLNLFSGAFFPRNYAKSTKQHNRRSWRGNNKLFPETIPVFALIYGEEMHPIKKKSIHRVGKDLTNQIIVKLLLGCLF